MSYKERLSKELEINYEISFEEACKRFPGLTRDNFDLIKYEYRRDVLGIKTKKNSKTQKNNHISQSRYKTKSQEQKKIKKLSPATIEKIILDMLNKKSSIPESQIRIAVDFMVKMKGKGEDDDLIIDAKYLKLSESEEGVEYEPGDKVKVEWNMDEFLREGVQTRKQGHKTKEDELIE